MLWNKFFIPSFTYILFFAPFHLFQFSVKLWHSPHHPPSLSLSLFNHPFYYYFSFLSSSIFSFYLTTVCVYFFLQHISLSSFLLAIPRDLLRFYFLVLHPLSFFYLSFSIVFFFFFFVFLIFGAHLCYLLQFTPPPLSSLAFSLLLLLSTLQPPPFLSCVSSHYYFPLDGSSPPTDIRFPPPTATLELSLHLQSWAFFICTKLLPLSIAPRLLSIIRFKFLTRNFHQINFFRIASAPGGK